MSEETAPAPAVEPAPDTGTPGPDSATPAGSDAASAGPGDAPGAGDDAQVGASAEKTPAQAPAPFRILSREFRDQKHAEEVLGAEVNKSRGLQRVITERDAELRTLREALLARGTGGQPPGQGPPAGKPQPDPQSFADELANSGELELLAKIAQDPEMGVGHAFYAMAQAFDKRLDERFGRFQSEAIDPVGRRLDGSDQLARAFSAAEGLSKDFPEIMEYENPPPEIQEAQARILDTLSKVPPEWLANNPKDAIWYAIQRNREQFGVPVIANQPGTSGSASAIVAAAAEKAAAATASTPLDGPGVPPQGERKGPETLAERWRREASHLPKEATSPSGHKLGFPESA